MAGGHPLFARYYDIFMQGVETLTLQPRRRVLLRHAHGRVLEIGFGTGANVACYDWSRIESLTAIEPDPYMLAKARPKLAALPAAAHVEVLEAGAEALPYPDATFDTVVTTLVLCTVPDVPGTLLEIRRVLKPGGELLVLEHVRADGLFGVVQDVLQPVYSKFAAGCHISRRTEVALMAAGFDLQVLDRFKMNGLPAFAAIGRVAS